MADLTKVTTYRDGASADITADSGAASQTIPYNRSDENIIIRVANADVATATIEVERNGRIGGAGDNLTFTVAQNEVKVVGALESMKYKDSDGDVTINITDADGTAYSGTVTNVTFEVIELPKSLIN